MEQTDAVITSGGVSMGDYDLVKAILSELGDFNWMQVAIKPAKPLAFGVMSDTPVFGLPGNPCRPWSASSCSPGRPCAA